jgi:predicted transcriptional regulator
MAKPASQDIADESSAESALIAVRRKIAVGLEQAERGELFDGEEVLRQILETL